MKTLTKTINNVVFTLTLNGLNVELKRDNKTVRSEECESLKLAELNFNGCKSLLEDSEFALKHFN